MKNLYNIDLIGRLSLFIQNALSERKFIVQVGASLFDIYDKEVGVPRGSFFCPSTSNKPK